MLVVDDHAVLRSGLRLLLNGQPDIVVVGEANDGAEALRQAVSLQPDLILLDLTMPGLGGLQALPRLRQASQARILILTMHEDASYLHRALRAGAAGYLLKKAADVDLLAAIRAVGAGEVYVHPALTRALIDGLVPEAGAAEAATGEAWGRLSDREREVLLLVALGHTNGEIGSQLALSTKTVETYRSRGMEKLGLSNRASLVKYVIGLGLLDEPPPSP